MEEQMLKEQLSEGRVLVDFWAPWCGPCRMQGPILEKFQDEQEDVKVVKVNVDENPDAASAFGIRSIPTLIYMNEGEVLNRTSGLMQLDGLHEFCEID